MQTVEIVDRPRGSRSKYPIAALLQTARTRKAVRLQLADGARPNSVVSALHKHLSRRGYKFCYRRQGRALIGWAERKATA